RSSASARVAALDWRYQFHDRGGRDASGAGIAGNYVGETARGICAGVNCDARLPLLLCYKLVGQAEACPTLCNAALKTKTQVAGQRNPFFRRAPAVARETHRGADPESMPMVDSHSASAVDL